MIHSTKQRTPPKQTTVATVQEKKKKKFDGIAPKQVEIINT